MGGRDGAPDAGGRRERQRATIAVQLQDVQTRLGGRVEKLRFGGVDENADLEAAGRKSGCDLSGALGRNVTRALFIKVEAEGISARVDRHARIGFVGDAADFDDEKSAIHAAGPVREFSSAMGSGERISDSPMRNAWKPAPRSRSRSARVWMPLSLMRATFAGSRKLRRSEVSSETSKVSRLRLLTPMISAPESIAFESSSESCTSMSEARPSEEASSRSNCSSEVSRMAA